ncbi:pyruvate carboxylase [bacterium 210917-DFI.7.65]|nr:pyruvate carboxylase [Clostridiales bacterium]MCB6899603.1 pyruvate carboxylase [bacterium 210917-DFI.7.65]
MTEHPIKKVLVANRGEIAIRVFRACADLDIRTVAMYSKEDTYSLFRTKADESYQMPDTLGPLGSYLNIPAIIDLAKRRNVDAIHPGYGFLSENAAFAKACEENGIVFVGPPSHVLSQMGDKLAAKETAIRCGVPIIPGGTEPLKSGEEALEKAREYGFPIMLKAAAGGGGRGMRRCDSEEEVIPAFNLVKGEAAKAFGDDSIFIEKFLEQPKHIEVQILADRYGNVVHLHERDCSLQRRFQKVVEFTPAFSVDQKVRDALCADAVKIAKAVGFVNAGTVEFLVDRQGHHYFIEMNPRIQVEHTVTEMVTGVDLVRAQLLIAAGKPLSDPEIGITCQEDIQPRGYAIQCRVTTEDPANNFAPDTGKITAYRSSGGFGIRLDGGNGYSGAEISPYYDSLLVKVTCCDNTFAGACHKALRALSETRVRGVKTNISFITNILTNETFRKGQCYTKFIDETPELFDISESRNRGNKLLEYIGNIVVNDPQAGAKMYEPSRVPEVAGEIPAGYKQYLDQHGPEALSKLVLGEKKLLVCDTTMRDAHQSLLATRVRSRDMIRAADGTAKILKDCFSLEMWGGATFDVAYRFLHESPWERLDALRKAIPNIPFQMLLRGANAVGYTNYPDNVIREFVRLAAEGGIDVFRVFDSLNWLPGMEVALDEVIRQGKFAEGTICYTGDVSDTTREKYTLKYYVDMAKELQKRGCHAIAIKDMAGLLKPYAARELVKALKDALEIPIQLHTHDTSGNQNSTILMAAEEGVDIVDLAIASMSSLTSQPSLNAVVAALEGQERDTGIDLMSLQKLTDYWSDVRQRYAEFESDLKTPVTDIYRYEIPGGQYTNLKPQVESLGLGDRFVDVKEMYKKVNDMLGDLVKVTPSSKMVGDMAIFMVQHDLTPENILEKGADLSYPDSVVSYFKGMMGQPAWGFPEALQKIVLKGETPITCRPGELLPPADFDAARAHLKDMTGDIIKLSRKDQEKLGEAIRENNIANPTDRAVISWCLYPKVYEEFLQKRREYGYISRLGSHIFFHGMAPGETSLVEIEDGKTLVIKYIGLGELNSDGERAVLFELNGVRREVTVVDQSAADQVKKAPMADPEDKMQIGAQIPGAVSKIFVKKGDKVTAGEVLAVIEAMKMETSVLALTDGVIDEIRVSAGDTVKHGELLMTMKEA